MYKWWIVQHAMFHYRNQSASGLCRHCGHQGISPSFCGFCWWESQCDHIRHWCSEAQISCLVIFRCIWDKMPGYWITPKPKLNKNGSLILTIVSVGCLVMGCLRIIQRSEIYVCWPIFIIAHTRNSTRCTTVLIAIWQGKLMKLWVKPWLFTSESWYTSIKVTGHMGIPNHWPSHHQISRGTNHIPLVNTSNAWDSRAGVRATPVLNRRRQESTMFSAGAKWMAPFLSTNASPKI